MDSNEQLLSTHRQCVVFFFLILRESQDSKVKEPVRVIWMKYRDGQELKCSLYRTCLCSKETAVCHILSSYKTNLERTRC